MTENQTLRSAVLLSATVDVIMNIQICCVPTVTVEIHIYSTQTQITVILGNSSLNDFLFFSFFFFDRYFTKKNLGRQQFTKTRLVDGKAKTVSRATKIKQGHT